MFIFCWLHVTKLIHTTGKPTVVNNCPADTTDPDEQLQQKKVKEKAVKVGMHDFLMRKKQRTWRSSEYPANKRRMPLSVRMWLTWEDQAHCCNDMKWCCYKGNHESK
jgi:hypothetical protein